MVNRFISGFNQHAFTLGWWSMYDMWVWRLVNPCYFFNDPVFKVRIRKSMHALGLAIQCNSRLRDYRIDDLNGLGYELFWLQFYMWTLIQRTGNVVSLKGLRLTNRLTWGLRLVFLQLIWTILNPQRWLLLLLFFFIFWGSHFVSFFWVHAFKQAIALKTAGLPKFSNAHWLLLILWKGWVHLVFIVVQWNILSYGLLVVIFLIWGAWTPLTRTSCHLIVFLPLVMKIK